MLIIISQLSTSCKELIKMVKCEYAKADLSTKKNEKKKKAWFSGFDEESWWQKGLKAPKTKRPKKIGDLICSPRNIVFL